MPEYEFPADDSIDDHVPDDEEVASVLYVGDTEVVETEKTNGLPDNLDVFNFENMTRDEVYNKGVGLGVDLNWGGDNADTKQEMIDKIYAAAGDSNE